MSNRHATTTTTTPLTRKKKNPSLPPPPIQKIVNLPPPMNAPKKKRNNKKKNKNNNNKELKWWEHAGPLIDTLSGKIFKDVIPAIMGFGDYEVNSNSITATASNGDIGGTVPIMTNSKHCNIIRHREYIGDVYSSTKEFQVTTYPINPGMDKTFPWLSPVALAFTNYRLRGLVFDFISTASNVATTPALGYVAMATQYNSLDAAFTNKRALDNSEYACSAAPTKSFIHPIECDPSMLAMKELYVRHLEHPSGDIRLYDIGRFSLATGGQATDDDVIGELWATYEIELYFPLLANQTNFLTNSALYHGPNPGLLVTPLAANLSAGSKNTMSLTNFVSTSLISEFEFPPDAMGQTYRVSYRWSLFAPISSIFFTGSSPDPDALTILVGTSSTNFPSSGVSSISNMAYITNVTVNTSNAVFRLTASVASTISLGQFVLSVNQIPTGQVS